MNKRLPLLVAGCVFTLVAVIHLLRLVYHWEILIAGQVIPMSFSVAGLIVAGILALWMFRASRS